MTYIMLMAIFLVQILILVRVEMIAPAEPKKEYHPIVKETLQAATVHAAEAKEKPEPKPVRPRGWTEVRKKAESAE